ncbi:unnamed protein product [Candidula unifasciata]|uniref:F-box domain-containing protein n=1 Tax=Candidula unifasciata TaxID=100452 RepID=A0A8S3YSD0_9EUPU|nr:unnamed protein product [Candidula unifasciata]
MAPSWPEEVDVFSVPHSRMKKLVHKYSNMITTTDFRDEVDLTTLLKNLMNVFTEFKAHEQIENILIMRKLKNKLKAASVTSAAVCNCHSDNRLTDMLDLVVDGYRWAHKTEQERQVYGNKLMNALDIFTQNFIPHMEEEEEVFQPMLMQYFSYEELKDLKAKVIYQHYISKKHEEYHHEKFVEDLFKSEDQLELTECHFSKLPDETCLQIFSFLGPRDLLRLGQVSQSFLQLSRDPSLWSQLHPVHWSRGNWSFSPESIGGVEGLGFPLSNIHEEDEQEACVCVDEDADIDESEDSDTAENVEAEGQKQILKEVRMLTAIVKYLLPQVGSGVKVCDLAYSRGLSSSLVHRILKLCPELEFLDLTHTNVGDIAFKEFGASGRPFKLRHLDLTGCENITDMTLVSLASIGRKPLDLNKKNDGSVEIENVPLPCNEKLKICCTKRIARVAHASDTSVDQLTKDENCDRTAVVVCDVTSGVSHDLMSETNDCLLQQRNVGSRCCAGSFHVDHHPQTSLVNFVYNNIHMKSDGTISSSSINSLFDASVNSCPSAQPFCDNVASSADPLLKRCDSSSCQRTCVGETWKSVKTFSEEQCGEESPCVAADEQSVPQPLLDCVGRSRSVSATCSNANHKGPDDSGHAEDRGCSLEYLSLNGCYRISDVGLSALAEGEGTPHLHHLDLSGCVAVTALGLSRLVSSSHCLDHANLFYCDNMSDDPYFSTASGCRNLQCETRFCCSIRE